MNSIHCILFLSECKCGQKNAADRIVNGNPADANEYPWQVGLKNGASSTYCGGTLVSSCHVLTAAHCFDSGISSNLAVALGDNDHMDLNEPTDVSCPSMILFCHVHLFILSTFCRSWSRCQRSPATRITIRTPTPTTLPSSLWQSVR